VPEGTPPTFDSSAPPSDESVIKGPTFLTDLPNAVTRAVARVRGSQLPSTTPNADPPQQPVTTPRERADDAFLHLEPTPQAELEQKLASLTATLQHAERRHAAAMMAAQVAHELAATEQLTEQERQFQVLIALEREERRTVEERLSAAASAREEAERRYKSALTDAAAQGRELERIGQREAELVAQSQRERAMHAALEQKIADADAHVRDMQQRHGAALTKAAGELAERQGHFDRELSRTAMEGDQLRERLIKAELAWEETRHDHESAAADVVRLARREADLSAQLATVQGELRMAEGRLSDAVREIAEARESASRERMAAEQQLELTLARESEAREILEHKLTQFQSAAVDVERGLREEAAALRGQALEREASFDARLASERLDYEHRLAEIQSECGRLTQAGAAATEDVQRLTADLSDARRVLEDTRREFHETVARQSTEHGVALAALAVTVAERDERLKEETAALRASERIRAELQECLQAALATGRHDIDEIQKTLMATLEAVRATKRRQDTLETKADHIAGSPAADESQATNTREVRQPEIAAWHQLSKDPALV
jgi:hypothetical protein